MVKSILAKVSGEKTGATQRGLLWLSFVCDLAVFGMVERPPANVLMMQEVREELWLLSGVQHSTCEVVHMRWCWCSGCLCCVRISECSFCAQLPACWDEQKAWLRWSECALCACRQGTVCGFVQVIWSRRMLQAEESE